MNKPSYRASYKKGQAYFCLGVDDQELILAHRWIPGDQPWTFLAGDELDYSYSYPEAKLREWIEDVLDPLTAEVTLHAFGARVNTVLEAANHLREGHLPVSVMAEELGAMLSAESATPLL